MIKIGAKFYVMLV